MNFRLCRCCGKPIAKLTRTHYVKPRVGIVRDKPINDEGAGNWCTHHYPEAPPRTRADVAKLTNNPVLSIRYADAQDVARNMGATAEEMPDAGRFVCYFTTWHEGRFAAEHFCSNACAITFAELMAREKHCTRAYNDALRVRLGQAVDAVTTLVAVARP